MYFVTKQLTVRIFLLTISINKYYPYLFLRKKKTTHLHQYRRLSHPCPDPLPSVTTLKRNTFEIIHGLSISPRATQLTCWLLLMLQNFLPPFHNPTEDNEQAVQLHPAWAQALTAPFLILLCFLGREVVWICRALLPNQVYLPNVQQIKNTKTPRFAAEKGFIHKAAK